MPYDATDRGPGGRLRGRDHGPGAGSTAAQGRPACRCRRDGSGGERHERRPYRPGFACRGLGVAHRPRQLLRVPATARGHHLGRHRDDPRRGPAAADAAGVEVEVGLIEAIDTAARMVRPARRRQHVQRSTTTRWSSRSAASPTFAAVPGMAETPSASGRSETRSTCAIGRLDMLEEARIETDPERRRRLLTFVVVGGGSTGSRSRRSSQDLLRPPRRASRRPASSRGSSWSIAGARGRGAGRPPGPLCDAEAGAGRGRAAAGASAGRRHPDRVELDDGRGDPDRDRRQHCRQRTASGRCATLPATQERTAGSARRRRSRCPACRARLGARRLCVNRRSRRRAGRCRRRLSTRSAKGRMPRATSWPPWTAGRRSPFAYEPAGDAGLARPVPGRR